jgi:site-specific DNA recombinase
MIVQRVIAGERISTIVKDLNAQGVPSPDGKQWDYGNTKRILLKQRYVIFDDTDPEKRGTLEHNGQQYRAQWQGLIDRQTYELMLARFEENGNSWKRGLTNGRVYLLGGLAYCVCGTPCYGNGRTLKDGSYQRRYRCRSQDNHGNRLGCGKGFRGADPLEDYVTEQALAKLDNPEVYKALIDTTGDDSQTGELLTKLTNQREHRKRLVVEYGEGLHSRQDYKLMLDAADNAIALTQAELAKARSGEGSRIIPSDKSIRDLWPDASLDWRREVLKLVVEKVVIKPGHPGSRMYKSWRFNPAYIEIVWRDVAKDELAAGLYRLLQVLRGSRPALVAA